MLQITEDEKYEAKCASCGSNFANPVVLPRLRSMGLPDSIARETSPSMRNCTTGSFLWQARTVLTERWMFASTLGFDSPPQRSRPQSTLASSFSKESPARTVRTGPSRISRQSIRRLLADDEIAEWRSVNVLA